MNTQSTSTPQTQESDSSKKQPVAVKDLKARKNPTGGAPVVTSGSNKKYGFRDSVGGGVTHEDTWDQHR